MSSGSTAVKNANSVISPPATSTESVARSHAGIVAWLRMEERAQTAEAMAEQIIAAELKRRRWNEAALRTRPQGGSGKGGVSGPAAGGDCDDGGLDRRTPGDGLSGLPNHLLYRQRKSARK